MRRDAGLIYAAGFVRSATVGLVGVTLAIHLADVGFSTTQIGLLIGVGLAGSSLATVAVGLRGDAWGRQRVLVGLALMSAGGYFALAAFTEPFALLPLAFVGMLNGMGRDRGAQSALDQAILPATVPEERRTWTLAWYTLVLDGGHAAGGPGGDDPDVRHACDGCGSGCRAPHHVPDVRNFDGDWRRVENRVRPSAVQVVSSSAAARGGHGGRLA